jgi:hypothetical protein
LTTRRGIFSAIRRKTDVLAHGGRLYRYPFVMPAAIRASPNTPSTYPPGVRTTRAFAMCYGMLWWLQQSQSDRRRRMLVQQKIIHFLAVFDKPVHWPGAKTAPPQWLQKCLPPQGLLPACHVKPVSHCTALLRRLYDAGRVMVVGSFYAAIPAWAVRGLPDYEDRLTLRKCVTSDGTCIQLPAFAATTSVSATKLVWAVPGQGGQDGPVAAVVVPEAVAFFQPFKLSFIFAWGFMAADSPVHPDSSDPVASVDVASGRALMQPPRPCKSEPRAAATASDDGDEEFFFGTALAGSSSHSSPFARLASRAPIDEDVEDLLMAVDMQDTVYPLSASATLMFDPKLPYTMNLSLNLPAGLSLVPSRARSNSLELVMAAGNTQEEEAGVHAQDGAPAQPLDASALDV